MVPNYLIPLCLFNHHSTFTRTLKGVHLTFRKSSVFISHKVTKKGPRSKNCGSLRATSATTRGNSDIGKTRKPQSSHVRETLEHTIVKVARESKGGQKANELKRLAKASAGQSIPAGPFHGLDESEI